MNGSSGGGGRSGSGEGECKLRPGGMLVRSEHIQIKPGSTTHHLSMKYRLNYHDSNQIRVEQPRRQYELSIHLRYENNSFHFAIQIEVFTISDVINIA